ncbi:MAG: esterase-like activity of phytase family protein [Ginsengibacter sp.]
MRNNLPALLTIITLGFTSCSSTKYVQKQQINGLKFLDEYVVAFNKGFENTIIGGLSGIDYDSRKDLYYLISDDRSAKNPARFYTAKLLIGQNKIDTLLFLKTTFLKDKVGNFYPNSRQDPSHTPDPEAMRYNPKNNTFAWSSEGERIISPQRNILQNPAIIEINPSGNYLDTFQIPSQLHMQATENGPRQNGVFEGLAFDGSYKKMYVSVEEPLYDDGPRAGIHDSTAITRIITFDVATKKTIAQHAYVIDAVAHAPFPPNAFKVNGISDILWLGKNKLLVVERSYSTGRLACTIKVFLADISQADNINGITSLKNKPSIKMASKKLLLNMDDLGFYIDNIEGVTFGPTLPNGKRTLLFVADNNFNAFEKTQFLLFEIQ